MVLLLLCSIIVTGKNSQETEQILDKAKVNDNDLEKSGEYINRMQEQNQERLQNMEQLRLYVNDKEDVIAEGDKEALLFGMFKRAHTYRYQITNDGDMIRQRRFFDFVWKDIEA